MRARSTIPKRWLRRRSSDWSPRYFGRVSRTPGDEFGGRGQIAGCTRETIPKRWLRRRSSDWSPRYFGRVSRTPGAARGCEGTNSDCMEFKFGHQAMQPCKKPCFSPRRAERTDPAQCFDKGFSAYAHAKRRGLHSATVVYFGCLELSMQSSALKIVQQMLLLRC